MRISRRRRGSRQNGRTMPDGLQSPEALGKRLARAGIAAFALHVGGAGLAECLQLLIARTVGAEGFGVYSYVFAWMTMLAYLAALGFDVSLLRFIPAYRARDDWSMLRGVIRYAERWVALVGLAVALAGFAVVGLWAQARPPALTDTFLIGLPLVPVLALLWIRASVVRAFGGVVSALAPARMVRDGLLLGALGIAVFGFGRRIDAPAAMLGTLLSAIAGLALVSLAKRRWMPKNVRAASVARDPGAWAKAALPLVAIGVAGIAVNRTGVVLLGWAGHTTDAGIYALAFNVAFLVVLPQTAINALFAPVIAGLFAQKEMAAFQALATKTAIWTLLSALCIALPLALLAEPLLGLFGPAFTAGAWALRLLLIGQVFAAGAGSQLYFLTMTGHERSAAVLMLLNAAVNAGLGAVLVHFFGLTGAAMGATATLILWNVAMALLIRRFLHVVPSALARVRLPPTEREQVMRVGPA